jgi:hypothetical protein
MAVPIKYLLRGLFSDTGQADLRIDASTHTLQTIDYEHHEIHGGSHFFVAGYADLAINDVLDFTWLMPSAAKRVHWTWKISTEAETLWQVYEGASETNPLANLMTPRNSNRNSTNTSSTTMRYEHQADLAAANADTDVTGATEIKSGICGAGKDAGDEVRVHEIILKQGTLYCLRATATLAGYINFAMQWYEHIDKD